MDSTPAGFAPWAPSARALRTLCAATLALFALLAVAGAQSASACVSPAFAPLALSTFEGADGDQCDSDGVGVLRDWQNIATNPGLTSTIDAPSDNDTIYGPNNAGIVGGSTDENVPDSWNFTNGSVGAGKFDALAASSFTDPENGKLFLDLGFVRATTSGDTFLAFELNQRQPGYRLDPNEDDPASPFAVPTRSAHDLLVTYHVGTGGAQELGLCVWDGDEHSGQWEEFTADLSGAAITNQSCPALSLSLYQAAINDGQDGREGDIPASENYLDPGTAIDAGQFGEAVVNLTDALRNAANPLGPQPCVDFGYVWLHSRSSDSLSSSQQDFIMPNRAVSIGNCTVEGSKFNDLDGDGSRSVGEPLLGGWTIFVDYDGDGVLDNNLDATFVNDFDGIVEAGEEEPYDITADGSGTEALGSYRITKVQPSNISDPAGTWPIREILQPTWDCTAAVGGGAVLAPNVCPEDTSTNPDNALGFRLAWTDNEIYSGRDFGNKRQPAQLTVIKHVVNDDGGSAAASAWSLHVTDAGTDVAGSPQAGDENGDTYSLTHGQSVNVSETGGPTGYTASYSGDCDSDGDVTVSAGQTKTCTITNDDVAPKLTVIKNVVNKHGSTATPADFTMQISGTVGSESFPGSSAGTTKTLHAGNFVVTETGPTADYDAQLVGCTGTLAVGDDKTCTITNTRKTGTITVVKNLIPSTDDGRFDLRIDGNVVKADAGDGDGSGAVEVNTGTHTVSEVAGSIGDVDDYASDISCTNGTAASGRGPLDVVVTSGASITCTITNTRDTTLTVIKQVDNGDGGTNAPADWTMDVTSSGAGDVHFAGTSTGHTITINPGAFSVGETAGAGVPAGAYTLASQVGCSATAAVGQHYTCTLVNDDVAPKLTVVKNVVNKHGSTATPADFTMQISGTVGSESFPGSSAGTTKTLHAGNFVVTETGPTGDYDAQLVGCTGTLAVGDDKTCTITNTRKTGTITVVKDLIPSTDDGRFDLRIDGNVVKADAGDGDGSGAVEVNTGTHTVSEVAGSIGSLGNYVKGISCSNGQSGAGATLDVAVTSAANITCTISNRRVLAQPIVVKAGDTFAYHGDTASYTFSVSNNGNSPLHDVHVSDDKCPNVSSAPTSKSNDDGDALLDPIGADGTTPEVWVFSCSYTIGAHQGGEANPVINTATVTALDELDRPVNDTDQHSTTLLHPAISLAKTGPATALAGSLVTYQLAVTNTGDVAFPALLVVLTDARCEAPPQLVSTGSDASTGTLDPGDSWRYSCSVQTAVGQTTVHNVADVDGTDIHGRHATAQGSADTALTQPIAPPPPPAPVQGASDPAPVVPTPRFPVSARLRGPKGCMPARASFNVTGTRIKTVTFTVDGRRAKAVRTTDSKGRYVYTVRRKVTSTGLHRLKAKITFLPGSTQTTKTLQMTFGKCRAAKLPTFTG